MPTYPNIHAYLDNSELHPPRDFSLAANDSLLGKNPYGDLQWFNTFWQRPVKAAVDGSLPAPTASQGDRYILLNLGTTGICSTQMVQVSITTTVDGTAISTTALQEQEVIGVCANAGWNGAQLNDIVEYFATDDQGNTVNNWAFVTPQQGYFANNLSNGNNWYFNGINWIERVASSGPDLSQAENHTYAEMQSLITASALQRRKQYWITDRSILLEATDVDQLSVDGRHTREIKAYGWIELTISSTGTSGSVDDIIANGIALLSSPVNFDTDLLTTAADVTTAINSGTGIHGYEARQANTRIILLAPAGLGASANGNIVTASSTTITCTTGNFINGQNSGANWFKVGYIFSADTIISMADNSGNIIYSPLQLGTPQTIDEFPWGYANVFFNVVYGGTLTAHGSSGPVCCNQVNAVCNLNSNAYSGSGCFANKLNSTGSLSVIQATGSISASEINNNGALIATQTTGNISGNAVNNNGSLNLTLATGVISNNRVNNTGITANGFTGSNFTGNQFYDSTVDISNASGNIEQNIISNNSIVTLKNSTGNILMNGFNNTNTDLTGFSGTGFSNNSITGYTLTGASASALISANIINGNGTLTFDNYTGTSFENNKIEGNSSINAAGASGNITGNTVFNATLDLAGFSGAQFTNNQVNNSTINAPNASGTIDGNILHQGSTIEADSASGQISTNGLSDYSELLLNSFTGESFLKCLLEINSSINAQGSPNEQSSIFITNNSQLDLTNGNALTYQVRITFPFQNIMFDTSQVNTFIELGSSNYNVHTTVDSSGIINLDQDYNRCAGVIEIQNSGFLNTILGSSVLPSEFYVTASSGIQVTIDSSAVTNIRLQNGITTVNLFGDTNDFMKIRKSVLNNDLFVMDIYNF